jgi:ribonucleoside-diphosphate reductase alpha chain
MVAKPAESKQDQYMTPPMPKDLPGVDLTENARQVLVRRYVRRDDQGKPAETVEEMFWRVAYHIARAEEVYKGDVLARAREFYALLTTKKFFPNSPTFTGAGTPLGQLAACFVLKISDDMGRRSDGIFQTLRDAALIQQTGGGNGFSFSRLRPKGTLVKSSAGQATGPVGFLRVYDHAFGEVAQGGCLLPETLVFTRDGLLRLDEMVDKDQPGWQEGRRVVATDHGWRTSPRVFNNGIVPVLRVHTRAGLNLAGTPEHKLKVMTAAGPDWRAIKDLQPGDWLIVQLGQQRGKLRALRHPVLTHFNQTLPHLPPVLDEELAFFIGYLIGDGFVASGEDDRRVGVSVSHASYLMKDMPDLMKRLFGVTIHRQQKENDRSVTFVIDNLAVKEFLQMNGLAKTRSLTAQVPRLIRQSSRNVVAAFLRGLYEANGSVKFGYPSLCSTSSRLVEEVSTLLIGLGCPVRIRSETPSTSHYGKNPIYTLYIQSSLGLQAWRDHIGCDPRSRFAACMTWKSDLAREHSYVIPYPRYWLEPVLESITLAQIDPRGRGRGINFRSENPPLRRALLRYMRGDRNLTRSGYDELSAAYPEFAERVVSTEGKWFVQVTEVRPEGKALTLDLEVDSIHTYLANGLVTHNSRRGANMAVLRVDHPDIEEFITCKTDENQITNFNISVGVTDAFMRAVKEDADWELRFPDVTSPKYREFSGTLEEAEAAGIPMVTNKTVRARDLFDRIVKQAHHNGEPGMLFLDAANRENPVPHLYQLESTNPCFIGSTRMATDRGLLTIAELAESESPFLVANDERAPLGGIGKPGNEPGVVYRPSSLAWKTRENTPVMRLTTSHGFTITATPDHKFLTSSRGYVALSDLQPGEGLYLQSGEGAWSRDYRLPNVAFIQEKMASMALAGDRVTGRLKVRKDFQEQFAHLPQAWSHELGVVLGCLIGDGWLSPSSNFPVGMVFNYESSELLEKVHGTLREYFGEGHVHPRESVQQLTYGRLPFHFFESLGVLPLPAAEKRVPASLWKAPREAVVGFLQGLFSTNGTVALSDQKKSCSIRLASASADLLREVQLLLLNFGIVGRIYLRRPEGQRQFPDGRGGREKYFAHADYELIIDKTNRDRFASEIGFLDAQKQHKVEGFISGKSRGSNWEPFQTKVVSVEDAGSTDVYDLTEPKTHSVIANGLVAHQCGEQFLGSYESCCLGSVNLNEHCAPDGKVDWETLRRSVVLATRFLDNVVDVNTFVPAVPQLKEAAHRARRIGLGIMGLADMMYHIGVRYGSAEGQEFGSQVMEFVRYHAVATSIQLARERGAFPAIEGSVYDAKNLRWKSPQPLKEYAHDWGRPALDWERLRKDIGKYGIRNAAQTTVAPTGTIATVAGCEGYGCEPVFALAYVRHVNDNGKDLQLTYASPRFDKALETAGIAGEARQEIVERVMRHGSCQDVSEVPESVRNVFVVASDITADEHVRMQAALQAFVDNSLSKTINFPETAATDDVARAYLLAWELHCKGITVYVTGSREKVVLETKATAEKKKPVAVAPILQSWTPPAAGATQDVSKAEIATQLAAWHESKKPRPRALVGRTYRVETPLGKAFITVNENGGGHPFEVFINTAKAGSETAAVSEAIGRLISYVLRLASPIVPRDRLAEVVRQLSGIGGGRSLGFGPNRVRSLPDGVGQVLDEYLQGKTTSEVAPDGEAAGNGHEAREQEGVSPRQSALKMGDLCPECGEATMVNEEGCRKCYTCGYSEC